MKRNVGGRAATSMSRRAYACVASTYFFTSRQKLLARTKSANANIAGMTNHFSCGDARSQALAMSKNNTAGVREREDENRTREAGNRDEVEGVVANTLKLYRNGAVGFIDWLDDYVSQSRKCGVAVFS